MASPTLRPVNGNGSGETFPIETIRTPHHRCDWNPSHPADTVPPTSTPVEARLWKKPSSFPSRGVVGILLVTLVVAVNTASDPPTQTTHFTTTTTLTTCPGVVPSALPTITESGSTNPTLPEPSCVYSYGYSLAIPPSPSHYWHKLAVFPTPPPPSTPSSLHSHWHRTSKQPFPIRDPCPFRPYPPKPNDTHTTNSPCAVSAKHSNLPDHTTAVSATDVYPVWITTVPG